MEKSYLMPITDLKCSPINSFHARHVHCGYVTATFPSEDPSTTDASCPLVSVSLRRYLIFICAKPESTKHLAWPVIKNMDFVLVYGCNK